MTGPSNPGGPAAAAAAAEESMCSACKRTFKSVRGLQQHKARSKCGDAVEDDADELQPQDPSGTKRQAGEANTTKKGAKKAKKAESESTTAMSSTTPFPVARELRNFVISNQDFFHFCKIAK